MASALDDIIARVRGLDDEDRRVLYEGAQELAPDVWVPNPGPQTEAYFCEADELGYGGEAGGGKSDLVIGLSLTAHERSLVLRRTNKEAGKFAGRYADIVGHRIGLNTTKGTWALGERLIEYGGCQNESDKQKYKGDPHDLICFDEVVDFSETMYDFITTWNRTTKPGQRCRIVATFNPPTQPVGMWVMKRWGPWVDENHPNPARDGEIRWYVKGPDDQDLEVEGRGPHDIGGVMKTARSRTFIRSRLTDNPDLMLTSDYQTHLSNLPEELREAFAEGKFSASLRDQPMQMIPAQWVRLAMQRRRVSGRPGVPMCSIGVDASGGGNDPMIIAPRYDGYYEDLVRIEGRDIPEETAGAYCAGRIIAERRDQCIVNIDCGGGYGNSTREHLRLNGVDARAHKGSFGSSSRAKDGTYGFFNKRTEIHWRFREALDPEQKGGSTIMLPESMMLLADLISPTFKLVGTNYVMEPKESVVERLGRSTDDGDAVTISWAEGPRNLTHGAMWFDSNEHGLPGVGRRMQTKGIMARKGRAGRH